MATREELRSHWDEVKERVQSRWQQVSDDELGRDAGDAGRLVDLIQRKTGAARKDIEQFLDDTLAEVQPALERAATTVKDYAQQAGESVKEYAHQAGESVQKGYEAVSDGVQAGYRQAEGAVRRNPLESVAVAFGAGLIAGVVVGLMTGRRA